MKVIPIFITGIMAISLFLFGLIWNTSMYTAFNDASATVTNTSTQGVLLTSNSMLSTGIGIILILGALLCGFLCIVLAFIEFKKQVSG